MQRGGIGMITLFLLVVSIYCIAGIMVHLYYSFCTLQHKNDKHYVLYTDNEPDILEWYYRSLRRFSKTMGVNVSITVVGGSATSQALSLIHCWQRQEGCIRYVEVYDKHSDYDIHIHLNDESDLKKLPF